MDAISPSEGTTSVQPDLSNVEPHDFVVGPYPLYRELRERAPVKFAPKLGAPPGEWLVTRYEDVREVLTDTDKYKPGDGGVLAGASSTFEGEAHARVRGVLRGALQNKALLARIEPLVQEHIDALLDPIISAGRLELVESIIEPLSLIVVGRLYGDAEIPLPTMGRWADGMLEWIELQFDDDRERMALLKHTHAEVMAVYPALLDSLTPDQAPAYFLASLQFSHLTRAEALAQVPISIMNHREPGAVLSLMMSALLSHPEQAEQCVAHFPTMRRAVDETLRWNGQLAATLRVTKCPVTLSGTQVPEGALVSTMLAASNHDEERFSAPEEFCVDRREGTHNSFGTGPHSCLGVLIIRAFCSAGAKILFEKLPNLRLAQDADVPGVRMRGYNARHLSSLWVAWDPPETAASTQTHESASRQHRACERS